MKEMNFIDIVQSKNDTACRVAAIPIQDKPMPEILISKWAGECYLSIRPGENGELARKTHINQNTLEIISDRRCHRIHRLDDDRIEYDVILEEKPKRPVITLPLEIPRGLSFYKQGVKLPHMIRPEVTGSYAVYFNKKNNQYKTGKFCHIYRPRIFDRRGFWCWGELEYDGRSLNMIIPEEFLSKCAYPITVDPIIGSSSVGASHQYYDGGWHDYKVEGRFLANIHYVSDQVKYECEAFIYSYHQDGDAGGYPCLYSHYSNYPLNRLSSDEDKFDLRYPDTGGEWLDSYMEIPNPIPADTEVWLAMMPHCLYYPYFDERTHLRESTTFNMGVIPSVFPSPFTSSYQIVLSMYLQYTAYNDFAIDLTTTAGSTTGAAGSLGAKRSPAEDPVVPGDSMARTTQAVRKPADTGDNTDIRNTKGTFERKSNDTEPITDSLVRRVCKVLKLNSLIEIWDYLTNRKAKSKDEVQIVSPACRELDIDSPI